MDNNNAPRPMSHIGCQDILEMEPTYSGWLKYRVTLVNDRLARVPWFGSFIKNTVHRVRSPWYQKYVVIHKGCVYIFNGDTSTKPQTAFSLYQYNMVVRAQQEVVSKNCVWAFKLVHLNSSSRYFTASSQAEMKIWMTHVSRTMRQANNVARRSSSSASGSSHGSDYSDIEEAIYGPQTMVRDSEVIEINNDDEEEEDYVKYREMPDDESIEGGSDADEEEDDTKFDEPDNVVMKKKAAPLPPLPKTPVNLIDSDMPTQAAPKPPVATPVQKKRSIDRPLPPLPNRNLLAMLATPPPPAEKANWQPMPTPGENRPAVQAKPQIPRGGVPCMLMPPNAKPVLKPKPAVSFDQKPAKDDDVTMATWNGPKEEIRIILIQISEDGAFAIRESSSDGYQKVLAVCVSASIKQYKIRYADGKYNLNEACKFDSVAELLAYYKTNVLPNTTICLAQPYKCYSS